MGGVLSVIGVFLGEVGGELVYGDGPGEGLPDLLGLAQRRWVYEFMQ